MTAAPCPKTTFEIGIENDIRGLCWIDRFGWLRPQELGRLLWPSVANATKMAERIVRKWMKNKLVLRRKLPDHNGSAIVIARAGCRLAAEHNHLVDIGTGWGDLCNGVFTPPIWWKHDLMAAGFLTMLHQRGYEIYTERQLREHQEQGMLDKIPDGIALKESRVLWIEVESARKTGPHMKSLVVALKTAACAQGQYFMGVHKPNEAIVVYSPSTADERGYKIEHKRRIMNAISESRFNEPVNVRFVKLLMRGQGVGGFTEEVETIRPPART